MRNRKFQCFPEFRIITVRVHPVYRIPCAVGIGRDAVVLFREGIDREEDAVISLETRPAVVEG